MKTIRIYKGEKKLLIEQYETADNIAEFEDQPHPYGFYHYPDNISDTTAFNRLKKVLLEAKEAQILTIKEEIKELKGLKYADATQQPIEEE